MVILALVRSTVNNCQVMELEVTKRPRPKVHSSLDPKYITEEDLNSFCLFMIIFSQ